MPIKKQKIGNNETTNILFGSGDIGVVTCKTSKGRPSTQLWLYQDNEKPESEWDKSLIDCNGGDSDQMPSGAIVLEFTKIKSIDQVIDSLNEIRKSMIGSIVVPIS